MPSEACDKRGWLRTQHKAFWLHHCPVGHWASENRQHVLFCTCGWTHMGCLCSVRDVIIPVSVISRQRHHTHGLSAVSEMWLSLFLSYPGRDTTHMGCLQCQRCDYPCFCHIQVETPHTWAVCSVRDVIIPVSVISRQRHHTHVLSAVSEMWLSLFLSYPGGDTTHMGCLQCQRCDYPCFCHIQVETPHTWPICSNKQRMPSGRHWPTSAASTKFRYDLDLVQPSA